MMMMAKTDVQWRCLPASQIAVIRTGRNARLQLTGLSCGIHSNVIITATTNITTITNTKTSVIITITTIITAILKTLVNIIIITSTPSEPRKDGQFLKRPVWRKISIWKINLNPIIQKYKLRRNRQDEKKGCEYFVKTVKLLPHENLAVFAYICCMNRGTKG